MSPSQRHPAQQHSTRPQEAYPPKDANEALLRGVDMEAMLARAERLPDNRIVRFADLRPLVFDGLRNRDK